jgi:hypothetical protein
MTMANAAHSAFLGQSGAAGAGGHRRRSQRQDQTAQVCGSISTVPNWPCTATPKDEATLFRGSPRCPQNFTERSRAELRHWTQILEYTVSTFHRSLIARTTLHEEDLLELWHGIPDWARCA